VRVLVAEDDATSRKLLTRVLAQWGYEVTATSDGAEAWAVLQSENPPPLAILDWMMPEVDGVELCRRVRMCYTESPLYIILLTGRDAKDDMVIGLDAGANDYLGKPFHREELRARVNVGRRFAELNQKLLETHRSLEILARTDPLTGTLNRRAMLERLSEEMARAARENSWPGLGMIDIDHFKHINDTYGHEVGDHVLMAVVGRSAATMRPYDAFGRFGGDEFLTILPHAVPAHVRDVLERIRLAACGRPVEVDGHQIEVTVSIGGATSRGESAEALIRSTDVALYQAKALGRNRVVMAETVA
jgi:two-component system, cell cycle response regulator